MTALLPALRPTIAATLAATVAATAFAQTPSDSLSLNIRLLPLGPGVTESRAGGGAAFGESGDFVVGGSINADGVWEPTLWARNAGGLSLPIRLDPPGQRGHVNAIANELTADGDVIAVGRSKPTAISGVAAAVWFAKCDGIDGESNDAVRVLLATPAGASSEAVDVVVTEFASDGVGAFVVGGSITKGGVQRAALWRTTNSLLQFEIQMLHSVTGAASSSITDLAVSPDGKLLAIGNTIDMAGIARPARWVIDGTSNTVMFSNFDLPNHAGTAIVGDWNGDQLDFVGAGGAHGYPHNVAPQIGRTDASGETQFRSLPVPPGHTGGTVNGIIAILIGLLVPGHTNGPAGQSACIWVDQPELPPTRIDLNAVARNLPQGTRLTTVQRVEPPTEEVSFVFHNITWFGASVGPGGRERAFIAQPVRQADSAGQLGSSD